MPTKDKPTALEPREQKTSIEVTHETRDELANLAHKKESYNATLKRIMKSHRECRCDWVKARAPETGDEKEVQFIVLDFRTKGPKESTREFVDRVVEEQLKQVGISLRE
jgi:hypothetical protein